MPDTSAHFFSVFIYQALAAGTSLISAMRAGRSAMNYGPKRKDPDIPIKQALALVPWPGASAEKIEQLVSRKIE